VAVVVDREREDDGIPGGLDRGAGEGEQGGWLARLGALMSQEQEEQDWRQGK